MIVARWPAWVGLGLAGAALIAGLVAGLAGGDGDGDRGPGWGRKRKVMVEAAAPRRADAYADVLDSVPVEQPRPADPTNFGRPSIRVTISADQVWLDGEALEDDVLVARFAAAAVADRETQVVFSTGADVPYQRVVRFMELAKQAGLERIALSSDPP